MDLRFFTCALFLASLCGTGGQRLGCLEGKWQCDDGQCISKAWRCDGRGDCLDGSDEMDCAELSGSECPAGQFSCLDSVGCVNASARCDGKIQCPTGSDEESCPPTRGCLDSDWMCRNGICIPKELRCNRENDCMDNSDEDDCGACGEGSMLCPEGKCVSPEEMCDGQLHCLDGSDEPTTCGRICSMNNGGCSHQCTDESWGTRCDCPAGFKLSSDGAICEDVNECASAFPPCAHYCKNTIGSHFCHCKKGFKLNDGSTCLALGNASRLLTVQRSTLGLLNVKSQQFSILQTSVSDAVALAYDIARGWHYWADSRGNIYKTVGQQSKAVYMGETGIQALACDWLNGYLYWTNLKTESIYMQMPDGSYTTLLNKNVKPSGMVLLPVESLMFWINAGPGERVTIERSWMDGTDRSTLTVLTAQFAHSLTADVAAMRLYWISDFKRSIETVGVDGTGRYSFPGVFSKRPALSLAVFESMFYWVDSRGLWEAPQNKPTKRKFLWKTGVPLLTVYHELQQPKGYSACAKAPCELCQLTKNNLVGFTCACQDSKVLLPDGNCDFLRFIYATITTINLLEFKGGHHTETQLFSTDDGILSFDLDWYRDWLYWANETGHVKRKKLAQVQIEVIPMPLPVCLISLDQQNENLYWVSCDQNTIGTTTGVKNYPKRLYHTTLEISSLYLDWLRSKLFWMEEGRLYSMDLSGGKAELLLKIAEGVRGDIAFDLRASSLLWNSEKGGLVTLSLLKEKTHQAGRRWNVSGSVMAAFEPFLLCSSDHVITLWNRRNGSVMQHVEVKSHVMSVIPALGNVKTVPDPPVCNEPSLLCRHSALCLPNSQVCDGKRDCPDGDDEEFCVVTCPSKEEFKCKDRRFCISGSLVCDGRSHCRDGSDEVDCPTVASPVTLKNVLKCRMGSKPCEDGTECVLFSHLCDGEQDCKDGSDELGCETDVGPSGTHSPTVLTCSSPAVLCPSTSTHVCISQSQFCNGVKDCPDGFDEQNCLEKCLSRTDFLCKDRRSCVSKNQVCDGRSHCHDGSDEVNCASDGPQAPQKAELKCRFGSKLCRDGTECVLLSHVCDGEEDCRDGSDEEECESKAAEKDLNKSPPIVQSVTQAPSKPACSSPSVLCPGSSICIKPTQMCDGRRDCPDGSDEKCVKSCPSASDFLCKDRRSCVLKNQVCDGRSHCHDGSDEVNCASDGPQAPQKAELKCRFGSKLCRDGTECVLLSHVCDGEEDCQDGSDEEECESKAAEKDLNKSPPIVQSVTQAPSKPACSSPSVLCPGSSLCIKPTQMCDGRRDCPDGSDEKCLKRCPSASDFLCKDRRSCVSKNQVCDGRSHCHDGSDEVNCASEGPQAPQKAELKCRFGSKLCRDGTECVLLSHVCDGEEDCRDGSDEEECDSKTAEKDLNKSPPIVQSVTQAPKKPACSSPSVLCPGSSLCIKPTQMCDGRRDCPDGSDEKCVKSCPSSSDFLCKDRRSCVSKNQVCDGRSHCHDGSDEVNCASEGPQAPQKAELKCRFGSKLCRDGTECVLLSHVCDGEEDCRDGSDEEECESKAAEKDLSVTQAPSKPACSSPSVLCPGSSLCIKPTQMCDGRRDCPDGSDEKCVKRCPSSSEFLCKDRQRCVLQSQVCDGRSHCLDASDELNCPSTAPLPKSSNSLKCRFGSTLCRNGKGCVLLSHICDGETDCEDGSDEDACDAADKSPSTNGKKDVMSLSPALIPSVTQAPSKPACSSPSVLCPGSSICIKPTQMCDGRRDCPDGSDEKCVKRCPSSSDFRCKDRRSCVSKNQVCDGRSHCHDGSDEVNCAIEAPQAPQKAELKCRFGSKLCRDGTECVLLSHVCDGEEDCQDGSDEEECESEAAEKDLSVTQAPSKPACSSPSVLCPGSSLCIKPTQMCDGRRDCPDGSDEKCLKRCPSSSEFLCKDRQRCVLQSQVCDGRSHCLDASDELNCPSTAPLPKSSNSLKCRFGSTLCRNGKGCVLLSHICDGETDCEDGSDEDACDAADKSPSTNGKKDVMSLSPALIPSVTQAPKKPACSSPSVLCPGSSICIKPTQMCDGKRDCPDGSDEKCVKRCPSSSDFRCKDRRSCVSRSQVCDGRAHCNDGSDELNCAGEAPAAPQKADLKCRVGPRLCRDGTECVLFSHVCDGEPDCRDGSDEEDCDKEEETAETLKPSCSFPSVQCPDSTVCINPAQLCDGIRDCPDGSDENCVKNCADESDFLCKDRRSCVSKSLLCDGRSHCYDGSDEANCKSVAAPESKSDVLQCRMGSRPCDDGKECVLYSHVCDGEEDCLDGSDEKECQETCKQGEFQCAHGKMCIPESEVCDGRPQCQDRSDELDCWQKTKSCEFRCADGKRCIPKKFLCDGEKDCLDGSDEVECDSSPLAPTGSTVPTSVCSAPSVLCPGSSVCVSQQQLCDGRKDCPDGSDEESCVFKCQKAEDFLCSDHRKCVSKIHVCDGRSHCPDGSDEMQCQTADLSPTTSPNVPRVRTEPVKCRKGFKACKDGLECVMYSHVCDGEQDCKDGSDEEGCETRCKTGEFQCAHGNRCVPQTGVCDGQRDCQDGSDEINCSSLTEGCHHRCDNNTRCVPQTFLCDGERDCADGSDEEKCGLVPCSFYQFRCTSGQCVSEALRCDGYPDCSDRSDEAGCAKPPRCPAQLRCPHSHECLQEEWLCDGEEDCKDGSDEKNCNAPPAKCRDHQWPCRDGSKCIPMFWRCDGKEDCHDGTDEEKCLQKKCPSHLYQCGSGECLDPSLACNGLTNCPDGSDEGVECSRHNCSSPSTPLCDQRCMSTPKGPKCYCASGFKLQSGTAFCVDADECSSTTSPCKHSCVNTRGSYTCHCHPGFYLEPDNKSCKTRDEPSLLASVQSELLLLGIHSGTLKLLSTANRPVFSVDFDWAQRRVYWLSPTFQSIRWADMKNSNKGTLIKGVKSDAIAVDWVGKNLYWVEGLVGQILAVKLGTSIVRSQDHTVVLGEDLEQPSSLVLLPNKGFMLWSEIGSSPQIKRAGMDGSKRKVLVSHDLSWPVSLAYDFLDDRVYWADEKLHCIGSSTLDGENIKILQLAETPSPFSLAVFSDRVFWSDTKRRAIRSADKKTGKDQKVLLKRPGQPFGLRVMHALSQPALHNPCVYLHCSHLCLLAPAAQSKSGAAEPPAAVCRCPKGLLLSRDKRTCSLPQESSFILLLSQNTVYQMYLRSMRHEGIALKKMPNGRDFALSGEKLPLMLDLSIPQLSLFVAYAKESVNVLKLSSSNSNSGFSPAGQILKLALNESVTALAVDWVTSNLFWSSSERPDIHVTSSEGHTTSLLQKSLMGITSIALHPLSGRLCYIAMVMKELRGQTEVDCAWMDGHNKAVLWRKSSIPISLVFSSEGTVIYWADVGEGVISSIGVDGLGYQEYKTGSSLLVSFTRIENILIWAARDKDVTKLWFSDGLQPKQLWFETKTTVLEVRAYNESQSGRNGCFNNGGCAHLCLPHPGGFSCICGRGFYSINVTSCAPLPSCPSGEEACLDGSKCFSQTKICDGHEDCPDQSDEWNCPRSTSSSSATRVGGVIKNSILPNKDSVPCDVKLCNGHGSCIREGKRTRCKCTAGYKGEFCRERDGRQSHPAVILVSFFLVTGVVVAAFVLSKRIGWKCFGNKSSDKETLMANMGLPENDSDSEELESPVDMKSPLQSKSVT